MIEKQDPTFRLRAMFSQSIFINNENKQTFNPTYVSFLETLAGRLLEEKENLTQIKICNCKTQRP